MKTIVMMAGKGTRFKNEAYRRPYYNVPKPFLRAHGKTIIEWTLSSLPWLDYRDLTFAVLKEDRVKQTLYSMFGNTINVIEFDDVTRGNLDTAYQTVNLLNVDFNEELLFLDSDNYYDGNNVLQTIPVNPSALSPLYKPDCILCHFQPIDNKTHWCFIKESQGTVSRILEKDPNALKNGCKPLVGTFWFKYRKIFDEAVKYVLLMTPQSEELYMSKAVRYLVEYGGWVYSTEVKNVIPLGTPEDFERFERENLS